jgi:hypothetical protein
MEKEEIIAQAKSYISQSINNLEVENPKIDFKAIWYKLTEPKGINEFLKDSSAIANSFGPDGMIIIGFDDKSKELHDSSFKDCGLKDPSQLPDLINKKVDRLFDLNLIEAIIHDTKICIIHIPPSFDKPHVIKNYQTFHKSTSDIKSNEDHKIFIRRVSSTYPASKFDLELMYYDRKNIIPDYSIISTLPLTSIVIGLTPYTNEMYDISGFLTIILENVGRRPVSIIGFTFVFSTYEDASPSEQIELNSLSEYISNPIIIQSGQISNAIIKLSSKKTKASWTLQNILEDFESPRLKHVKVIKYVITLSDGKQIESSIQTYHK